MMRIILFFSLVAAVIAAGGCGGREPGAEEAGRTVVASFYPLAYAASQVAGPGTTVANLTAAGVEPHDLELTPRQARTVADADLVLYLGKGFQPAVETAVEARDGKSADLLAGEKLFAGGEGGTGDPHVWLDPVRYAGIVRRIGDALGRPDQAEALAARVLALDRDFEKGLARCERRTLVTSHAAFGYLASRYGLEQVALSGISPEAEPSPKALEELVDRVREAGATTVFFETLVSGALAETVARETGATTAALDPLEGLTEDASASGADWFSVMRENLAALRKALGCR